MVDADESSNNVGDNQPSSTASNKRKSNNNNDNHQQSNKRQKQKQNKNKNKNANNNKHKRKHQNNNNWIENCSESIHRIPINCAAPLICVVTRVEIEEEPLLPEQNGLVMGEGEEEKKNGEKESGDGEECKGVSAETCTAGDGKEDKDDIVSEKSETTTVPTTVNAESNIARPSLEFVSQYQKEKKVPWKVSTTVQVDNKEKKLFIPVKRHASATGPTKWAQNKKKKGKKQPPFSHHHLPGGDSGDGILNPYPSSSVPDKFWAQRKRLFSRYDEGIQIGGEGDTEMWYSVTPESIANHVAGRMVKMVCDGQSGGREGALNDERDPKGDGASCDKSIVILDVFCGCGGNSIAFARLNNVAERQGDQQDDVPHVKLIAVDNNLSRLKMAANNAAIYKVGREDIVFVHADAVEVLNCYSKGARIQNDGGGTESSIGKVGDQSGDTDASYAGYAMGGIELLPDNLDGIFLSPPWGGMDYGNQVKGKSRFDPITSIMVESSCLDETQDGVLGKEENGDKTVKTNGGELLSIATKAVFNDSKQEGVISYFLPRNTDGISTGQIAVASGIGGYFEMEQNVVNGKVKTVTAYFGHQAGEALK